MNAIAGSVPWTTDAARSHEARPWLVIHDPSGDFENSAFRMVDLLYSQEWPEGIIFWHRVSGEVRVWRAGRYQRLSPNSSLKKRGAR